MLEDGWQLLLGVGTEREGVSEEVGVEAGGAEGWGWGEDGEVGRVTSLSLLSGCRTSLSRVISNSARMRASWF